MCGHSRRPSYLRKILQPDDKIDLGRAIQERVCLLVVYPRLHNMLSLVAARAWYIMTTCSSRPCHQLLLQLYCYCSCGDGGSLCVLFFVEPLILFNPTTTCLTAGSADCTCKISVDCTCNESPTSAIATIARMGQRLCYSKSTASGVAVQSTENILGRPIT